MSKRFNTTRTVVILPILSVLSLAGCAAAPVVVKPGDQVGISFTCSFANGDLAISSSNTVGLKDGRKRSAVFLPRENNDPIVIEAGQPEPVPRDMVRPMEEEALQQLRSAILGVAGGESRAVELRAVKMDQGIIKYNRETTQPKEIRLKVEDFKTRTGKDPKAGDETAEIPGLTGRIGAIEGDEVIVRFTAIPGATVDQFYGRGIISDEGDQYRVNYSAEKGTLVRSGYLVGRVVDVSEGAISVDYGDQFAGDTLACDLKVDSVKPGVKKADIPDREAQAGESLLAAMTTATAKGSTTVSLEADNLPGPVAAASGAIAWQEEHDAGLALAALEGKPAVLVLYADWCGYCKKLFNETIPDSRISSLQDRFTWIKVNSDKLSDIKSKYGQKGYPLMVLFKADGTIAGKIDGFKEPAALAAALKEML